MPPVSTILALNAPGTWILEDNGDPSDGVAQLRGPNGAIRDVYLPTTSMKITVSEPGVSLQINLDESLGEAKLTVGDLNNSALSPDSIIVDHLESNDTVTLVANGRIIESTLDEDPKDIIAPRLIMSAGAGVGQDGNPIEIQTGALEVETNTNGIWLENYSDVVIGGLTPLVSGLDVATSGGLFLFNAGSVRLSDTTSDRVVHGGSSASDVRIIAGGSITSDVGQTAVNALGGSVKLVSGGDIRLGEAPFTVRSNDIQAAGSITLDAAGQVILAGDADLISNIFGLGTGGIVTVRGRGGIAIDGTADVSAIGGGDIILVTDPGGNVALTAASQYTVHSTAGGVSIQADSMTIGGFSGITAATGVTLLPASLGRAISLGGAADSATALALSGFELNRIFAPGLDIGNLQSGPVTVDGVVDLAGVANLGIHSAGDILIDRDITLSGSVLLETSGSVLQSALSHIGVNALNVYVDLLDANGVGDTARFLGSLSLGSPLALFGGADGDTLVGTSARDRLVGGAGNDTLDGAGGVDYMSGGDGDDTYVVDDPDDQFIEAGAGGNDTVRSSVGLTLDANIENLVLTGTANMDGFGNALDNVLLGNGGNNLLNGLGGADIMAGGLGNDTYYVDSSSDQTIEDLGGGTDTIVSAISHTLAANIETLTLTGGADIDGTGNALDNILNGTSGNNRLDGLAGADLMRGGLGDDDYVVDAGDVIVEAAGGGQDVARATASFALNAGAEVEILQAANLSGTIALDLTGNELDNRIIGNAGANRLDDGNGGLDRLKGLAGDDTYFVGTGDIVLEGASEGQDVVKARESFVLNAGAFVEILQTADTGGTAAINLTGNELDNSILGNSGRNILDGGTGGIDRLKGFGGDDVYFVATGDLVLEDAGGGNDSVKARNNYVLNAGAQVEILKTANDAGTGAINLTGNELANRIIGNDGDNVLKGGLGADILLGNDGADRFVFNTTLGPGNIDTILDFQVGVDEIGLDDGFFAGLALGALPEGAFHTGAAAADADDRIIYNSATGALLYDLDGNGAAAAVQFATAQTGLTLAASDFVVI